MSASRESAEGASMAAPDREIRAAHARRVFHESFLELEAGSA